MIKCTFHRDMGHLCGREAVSGTDRCDRHPKLRSTTPPPALPNDPVRLHVAMWKIANALGVKLEAGKPDHELLEKIADGLNPKLAEAFRDGYRSGHVDGGNATLGDHEPALSCNPFDGSPLR